MYRPREILRGAVSLILPNRCPFCDGVVRIGEYWCEECYKRLPFMEERAELPKYLDGLLSVCHYRGRARSAVLRMKKGGYAYAPEAFAVLMTELASELMGEVDLVTAVPCTFKRRLEIGFPHAEKLARDIARRSRKPYKTTARVTGEKREQKKLNREQRLENARRSYKIADKEYIKGKNILIVDDVSTTGATLSAIAEQLKAKGAGKVFAVTFAQA